MYNIKVSGTPIFEHNGARYKKPIHLLLNIVLNISDRFVCIISPTWSRKNYADNHKESHAHVISIYISNDMRADPILWPRK
jgi:hypothetical protein